jgi:hypothetical protein
MDYIRLVDITNQYPNLPSYVRQNEKLVNLFGLYKETNKLEFKMPSIEHIKPVDDLSLRLIFGFRKNVEDKNIQYFTSQQFYSDMEASNIEGNPYFYLQSNKVEFIVLVNLEKFISTFEGLKEIENKQGINVKINNFINEDNSVNYERLMRYLNWVLSKPSLDEIDTDGVIPAERLAEWEVGDYDPIMMKWKFSEKKNNTSGNSSSNNHYKLIKIHNVKNAIAGDKRFIVKEDPRISRGLISRLRSRSRSQSQLENQIEILEGNSFYGIIVQENFKNTYKLWEIFEADGVTKRGFLLLHNEDDVVQIKENTSTPTTNEDEPRGPRGIRLGNRNRNRGENNTQEQPPQTSEQPQTNPSRPRGINFGNRRFN